MEVIRGVSEYTIHITEWSEGAEGDRRDMIWLDIMALTFSVLSNSSHPSPFAALFIHPPFPFSYSLTHTFQPYSLIPSLYIQITQFNFIILLLFFIFIINLN